MGPYRVSWNKRISGGGNMWVTAVVQKIPLGISIRPQFIMLWKIMGAFLRQILLPIFTANITRFLDICLGSTQLAQFCQNIGHFNYPWLPFVSDIGSISNVSKIYRRYFLSILYLTRYYFLKSIWGSMGGVVYLQNMGSRSLRNSSDCVKNLHLTSKKF